MLVEMCFLCAWREWLIIKVNLLVKTCLRNEFKEYNIKGIYDNFKIKFKEIDSNTLMIIDLKNKTINRITNDLEILLDFENNICNIVNKEINGNFKIELKKLNINNNEFLVEYKIEDDYFKIEIKIIWILEEFIYEKRTKTRRYWKFIL